MSLLVEGEDLVVQFDQFGIDYGARTLRVLCGIAYEARYVAAENPIERDAVATEKVDGNKALIIRVRTVPSAFSAIREGLLGGILIDLPALANVTRPQQCNHLFRSRKRCQ